MSKEHPNVELLRRFNTWRRGGNGAMPAPVEVGVAIDWAIGVCAAAHGLVAVKGRHHSQQAYEQLAAAVKVGAGETAKEKAK